MGLGTGNSEPQYVAEGEGAQGGRAPAPMQAAAWLLPHGREGESDRSLGGVRP